jgi:hypothetical protein
MSSTRRTVFWDIHSGLPREGPGNRESTARALRLAASLPNNARVLDIACGQACKPSTSRDR